MKRFGHIGNLVTSFVAISLLATGCGGSKVKNTVTKGKTDTSGNLSLIAEASELKADLIAEGVPEKIATTVAQKASQEASTFSINLSLFLSFSMTEKVSTFYEALLSGAFKGIGEVSGFDKNLIIPKVTKSIMNRMQTRIAGFELAEQQKVMKSLATKSASSISSATSGEASVSQAMQDLSVTMIESLKSQNLTDAQVLDYIKNLTEGLLKGMDINGSVEVNARSASEGLAVGMKNLGLSDATIASNVTSVTSHVLSAIGSDPKLSTVVAGTAKGLGAGAFTGMRKAAISEVVIDSNAANLATEILSTINSAGVGDDVLDSIGDILEREYTNTIEKKDVAAIIAAIVAASQSDSTSTSTSTAVANAAPVATNLSQTIVEDTATELTLAYTDAESDNASSCTVSNAVGGTLGTCGCTAGVCKVIFTPTQNLSGASAGSFSFTVSDGKTSNTASATLSITAVDDSPVLSVSSASTQTVNPSTAIASISLSATDAESDAITYTEVSQDCSGITLNTSTGVISGSTPSSWDAPSDLVCNGVYRASANGANSNTVSVAITLNVSASNVTLSSNDASTFGTEGATYVVNNLTISGATVDLAGGAKLRVLGTLLIQNNGQLRALSKNTTAMVSGAWAGQGVEISAANVTIESGSTLTGAGLGYAAGSSAAVNSGAGPAGSIGATRYGVQGGGGHNLAGGTGTSPGVGGSSSETCNTFAPVTLGSGSGSVSGFLNGAAGGGAIKLLVSGTLSIAGSINANGGNGSASGDGNTGGGAGGSIWVMANAITGAGSMSANGGTGGYLDATYYGGGGSGGCVAVYYVDSSATTFNMANVTATKGAGKSDGGKGSVAIIKVPSLSSPESSSSRELTVYKDFYLHTESTTHNLASVTVGVAAVGTGATMTLAGGVTLSLSNSFTVTASSNVYVSSTNIASTNGVGGVITAAQNITVASGSTVTADGLGYSGGAASGTNTGYGNGGSSGGGRYATIAGGTHGGVGGTADAAAVATTYGSSSAPVTLGSGTGSVNGFFAGVAGGGAIKMKAGSTFTISGTITANGTSGGAYYDGSTGAGSGGSIYLIAPDFSGSGVVTANGGNGACYSAGSYCSGSGGGGRVAIHYTNTTFAGTQTATGGTTATAAANRNGADGSVYVAQSSSLPN